MHKKDELVSQLATKVNLICISMFVVLTESKTYGCFCQLMRRMTANFPHGGTTMDDHFDRMRLLIQVLSSSSRRPATSYSSELLIKIGLYLKLKVSVIRVVTVV